MTEPYRIEFLIPMLPKMVNGGWGKSHWAVQAKYRRQWRDLIVKIATPHKPLEPLSRARLTLIRFSSSAPDSDNLAASFKHVIDGLVDAGVLIDDRFENIGMPDYRWEKAKPKEGKIVVRVEAVSG